MEAQINSRKWQDGLIRSGYFVGAVLLHLILFLMVATLVVFKTPVKEDSATFLRVSVAPPPPPPPAPPPPAGGDAINNLEPAAQTTPPPSVSSIVATTSPSAFSVKAVKVSIPNLPASITTPTGSGLSGASAPGQALGAGSSPFGSEASIGAAQLQGYLYDLKQTPDRKPTNMIPGTYHNKLSQFVKANWNPDFLAEYYKSPKPLNTSSIFIPTLSAMDGPKAFGVEKEVQPNMYVIWYRVKAAPTQDGAYHFVGVADDILLVRVNGRTVLDGCLYPVDDDLRKKETKFATVNFAPSCPPDSSLYVGDRFQAFAGESLDIDILIGEEPGGRSNYFLYIQREQSTYPTQSNGTPLLPIFQLDSNPIHPAGKPQSFPPFSSDIEAWGAGNN
jgi:hypothetical protein